MFIKKSATRRAARTGFTCIAAAISALILLFLSACETGNVAAPARNSSGIEVHYIDVGQADSALVLCGDSAMLIDGGNVEDSQLVVSYLQDCGVSTLDYLVCTHAHEDHVGGLAGVLAVYEVKSILCPVSEYDSKAFRDFANYANEQDLELRLPDADSSFVLGDADVTVIAPREDYSDTNDTSIVLRIDYGDVSFLFTGDAERQSENDIMDAGIDVGATVLKVGHHGSSTSSSYRWIYEVEPDYAVISVGQDNSYGHPHDEVMSRLHDADVKVYRTDIQGHIICTSDGRQISFETQRNSNADTNPQPGGDTLYIGNSSSMKLHRDSCSNLPAEHNRVYFASRSEAIEAGYSPCGSCKP